MSVRRLAAAELQPASFVFSDANLAWAKQQVAKYPEGRQASAVIPVLWRAQEQSGGWVSRKAIEYVAGMLGMAPIRVLEVATFYTMFQLEPVGRKAHVQVCGTTPCMLSGSEGLKKVCEKRIHHDPFHVSADGDFSWEEVECLGACVNAPMVLIGEDTYEDLTPESFEKVLNALARGEKPTPGPQNGRQFAAPAGGDTTLTDPAIYIVKPKAPEPKVAEPEAAEAEAPEPKAAEPEAPVQPAPVVEAAKQPAEPPAAVVADVAAPSPEPKAAEPKAAEPTAPEPTAPEPKAAEPEAPVQPAHVVEAAKQPIEPPAAVVAEVAAPPPEPKPAEPAAPEPTAPESKAAEPEAPVQPAPVVEAAKRPAEPPAAVVADVVAPPPEAPPIVPDAAAGDHEGEASSPPEPSPAVPAVAGETASASPAETPVVSDDSSDQGHHDAEALAKAEEAAISAKLAELPVGADPEERANAVGTRPDGLTMAREGGSDNLQRIKGIGPSNERKLHALGIYHFDQIAAWGMPEIRWVGTYLAFPGRIFRENWVAQATVLAAGEDNPLKPGKA